MRSKFKWIFTLLLAFTMQFSFAQEKTVTGTVTNGSITLPGANVKVKGTSNGVQTDLDGKFSIKAKPGDVLEVSFLGHETKTIKVGAANTYNVTIAESSKVLDEVVVQGYGKSIYKKKDPGATATVSGKIIENRPNVNFLQSLQGQLAGTNIALSSGQPGTNKIDVVIRGASSLLASTDPLYVIDGVPLNQAFFRNLNPNDVESVTVLKDASATAIYGNRGANGVIVITTKKGSLKSKLAVSYSSTFGTTQFRGDQYDLVNSREHLTLQNIYGVGAGFDGFVDGYPGLVTVDPNNIQAYNIDTDWTKVFFRVGKSQSHNISLTAGSENLSNFTSLSYYEEDGIVPTTSFKRFTLRSNINGKSANDKINYGLNILATYSRRRQLEEETRRGINTNVLQNPLTGYLSSPTYLSPDIYVSGQQLFNTYGTPALQLTPYMLMDLFQDKRAPSFFDEFKTIITSNLGFKVAKNLTFTTNAGVDFSDDRRVFAIGPEAYLSIIRAVGANQAFHGLENMTGSREFMFNFFNRLNYKKVFADKHTLDASVFTEYMKAHRRVTVQQHIGLNPLTWSPGAGTGYNPYNPALPTSYIPTVAASRTDAGTFSYFGTLDYDYNSKYGFAASVRRDASYRFVEDNKWGTFWSVAGRWNINKEDFMKDNTWFRDLKLRASYGTTGNQNVIARGEDSNQSTIFAGAQLVRDLNSTQTGYGNVASFGVATYANTNLQWETVAQFNVGLDFDIKGRLVGSMDYYKKNTYDFYYAEPVSFINGISTISNNVDGNLQNEGFEVNLRYNIFKDGDFKLSVFANGAYNKQEIKSLGGLDGDGDGRFRQGTDFMLAVDGPSNQYFLVPYAGVNPANGNMLFLDINNNLTENPTDADRRLTDKNEYPLYQGGFGLNTSYKGFFLDATFVYSLDFYRFDPDFAGLMDIRNAEFSPVSRDIFNAWTTPGQITDVPAWNATNLDSDSISDRFLQDASFLRLRNLTIGYDVPSKFLEKTFIKGIKFKVQGENILTFTKWRGMDPESFSPSVTGFFPTPKAYTFGVDVNF